MSIQYRVAYGKNDEAVDGPDDAEVVVTVGVELAPPAKTVAAIPVPEAVEFALNVI